MLGRHLGQSAGRTLRLWQVLALSLAALLGAALAANTASPLQAQTTPTLSYLSLEGGLLGARFPLRPNFAPHITEYTASVPSRIDDIDLGGLLLRGRCVNRERRQHQHALRGQSGPQRRVQHGDGDGHVGGRERHECVHGDGDAGLPPPAPTDCPADTDWCATMVVGHSSTTGVGIRVEASGYGYNERTGDLSSDRFVHDGTVYQVSDILRWKEFSSGASSRIHCF